MDSIRFTQMRIKLVFPESCSLPMYKVSAIRGGMGQMLLAQNCIQDENCHECGFASSCIAKNIMYAPFKIKPPSVTNDESMGYVIDCTDTREQYKAGDSLLIRFTLFGDTISYIMPIIYALTMLGSTGIGKGWAKFQIAEITNRYQKPVLRDGMINLKNVLTETVGQYVNERMDYNIVGGGHIKIKLLSPCTVKYQGKFLEEFNEQSLVVSMLQKLYHYQLYEGNAAGKEYWEEKEFPVMCMQQMEKVTIPRYSTTQERKMYLKGIQGELELAECGERLQRLLYATEILHLGKNTRFGFGKIQVSVEEGYKGEGITKRGGIDSYGRGKKSIGNV